MSLRLSVFKSASFSFTFTVLVSFSIQAWAQTPDSLPAELKKLSIEELMNIEVTSVSKRPEKLADVASGIQVITRQDILRSAATSVPEALRLCTQPSGNPVKFAALDYQCQGI